MANYSLTVNSTFQPFTYQELAAPLDRQELYHEKLAEEYDKLSAQADVLEAMGANERDKNSGTYVKYKAYSDALRKEADNLYQFGLNTESRQRLTDLRRRYNTEIVPIQNAWNKREQESADQMKAQLANPSLMFTRDARTSTLDDYIKNPTGGYGVINGANISAQMASMAKNLASPEFTSFLMNHTDSVFILEDCETVIKQRSMADFTSAVSSILNMSDGIMSDIFNGKFICTFNADMRSIDDAILRKGRCYAKYTFGKLDKEKAKVLLNERGITLSEDEYEDMVLADIYHYEDKNVESANKKKKIGF
jgi:hypothetical protein